MKKTVAIGLLGPTLDRGGGKTERRWEQWRPSVALCQHEDLLIDRFELLFQKKFSKLAEVITKDIRSVSPETEVQHHLIEFKDPWDFEDVYGALHDFTKTIPFDPEEEDYLIHITTGTHVAQICLFLLTEAHYLPGALVQTAPPARSSAQHPGSFTIIDLDLSKYDRIASRFRQEAADDISFLKSGIETRNEGFNRLIERIERVAVRSSDPLLLTGPTGAGKSQLARRIYDLKKARRQIEGAFVEVNCATLRGDAAMSALFGHRKGAFTGALQDRQGLLRTADGGLLFLDEVGELGLDEQAMLLRAVEEKRFLPLGADRETESRFQLICGSNRDLQKEVAESRFREDLLSRINLWTFRLPGLRDRTEDIEPNLLYELDRFAERTGTHVTFSKQAREYFLSFAASPEALWRANFRDLIGAVTRMATLAPGGRVALDVAVEEIDRLRTAWRSHEPDGREDLIAGVLGEEKASSLDRFDRAQLADVIEVCRATRSISEAGRILFQASRTHKRSSNDADRLSKYLRRFGLQWELIKS